MIATRRRTQVRNVTLLLYALVLLVLILQLTGCGGGKSNDPTPAPTKTSTQDDVKSKLTSGTWNLQGVSVDGVDKTSVYKGLTLKFGDSNFTSTNGGTVWPASGSWSFAADDGTKIKRDDGMEVLVEVTSSSLKLTLTWTKTTLSSGRVASVKGKNVFSFTK